MFLIAVAAALQLTVASHEFVAADGTVLRFADVGSGTPIVLLSGGPGFSSSYMQPIAKRLAGEYRSILPDQRGTGQSPLAVYDRSTISLAKYVDDMDRLRETLGLDDFVLVGHSWGGMLAMAYAAEHPNRVRALVLVGSGGPTLDFMEAFDRNLQARFTSDDRQKQARWANPAAQKDDPARAAIELLKASMPAYFYDRDKGAAFAASLGDDDFESQVFDLMIADLERTGFDVRPGLGNVHVPTLVIQGRQDPIATADAVHGALPDSRLEFLEGAGHFPWLEQPDGFFRLVRGFLEQVALRK